ncbi:MAG TPA: hypothetical protein VJH95_04915 [Candidatus Nanoarchaeia archaeon]|nr:hypothetical protein [Candidatus Nanoarchaeia archaeon]
MAILGLTFDKITIEKDRKLIEQTQSKNIQVNYNIAIKNLEEDELKLQVQQKILRFDFTFSIIYNPKIGVVELLGHLLYVDPNHKKILEAWKKDQDITDNQLKAHLLNAIFQRANLKAISLIQEVNLPLHFPLPRLIPPGQNPQSYIS